MRVNPFPINLAPGLALAALCAAQSLGPVQGPPLGAEFDSGSGSLLPIQGVPGSATMGIPFATSGAYSAASISAERGLAIALKRDTGQVLLVTFTAAAAVELPIAGATPSPDRIILSPSGTAALLWHSAEMKAEAISGLPGSPSLRRVDLGSLDRTPDLVAISDDGSAITGAFNGGTGSHLERWTANGLSSLAYPADITALTFLRKSPDALLADPAHLALVRYDRQSDGRIEQVPQSVGAPAGTALGLSRDNSRVLVAPPQGSRITVIDLPGSGNGIVQGDCNCLVQGLVGLRGNLVFQLSRSASGPATVVDASGARPAFSVIPARPGVSN